MADRLSRNVLLSEAGSEKPTRIFKAATVAEGVALNGLLPVGFITNSCISFGNSPNLPSQGDAYELATG